MRLFHSELFTSAMLEAAEPRSPRSYRNRFPRRYGRERIAAQATPPALALASCKVERIGEEAVIPHYDQVA